MLNHRKKKKKFSTQKKREKYARRSTGRAGPQGTPPNAEEEPELPGTAEAFPSVVTELVGAGGVPAADLGDDAIGDAATT